MRGKHAVDLVFWFDKVIEKFSLIIYRYDGKFECLIINTNN